MSIVFVPKMPINIFILCKSKESLVVLMDNTITIVLCYYTDFSSVIQQIHHDKNCITGT